MDYYSILGVPRNASDQDIRKAYKKASMRHHPDRGGDEEQFKRVNEAYSTLKDPQKKAMYDQYGTADPNQQRAYQQRQSNPFGPGFEDIFASMFGGQYHRRAQPQQYRNPDVKIRVDLELEDVLAGKSFIATYKLRNGREQNVDINIPAGVNNGDSIRYPGLGDDSIPHVPRGDLFVIAKVRDRAGWLRNNNNLKTTIHVNCLEMIIGTTVIVNTLDKKNLELKIPPGTKNGTTFSVQGYGIPDLNTKAPGQLLITIEAQIPKDLKEEQLSLIRQILNENG